MPSEPDPLAVAHNQPDQRSGGVPGPTTESTGGAGFLRLEEEGVLATGILEARGRPVRLPGGGEWVNPGLVSAVVPNPESGVVMVCCDGWSIPVDPAKVGNMDGLSLAGCVDYVAALVWDLDLATYPASTWAAR